MKRSSICRTGSASRWGLFAGVVGSLCCLGPTAALLLGFGSSSALFGLQFDQSWALGASGLMLAGGALQGLRSRSRPACGIAPWRQPLTMVLAFAVAYSVLGVLLPLLAAQQESSASVADALSTAGQIATEPALAQAPELHRLTLIIEKMNCPPCAAKVHNRLAKKPAVHELRAEAYNEEVVITYDSRISTGDQLIKLFPRQYGVTLIRDEPLP